MRTITDLGTAIWSSLARAVDLLFAFIPRLIGFVVILLIGWLISSLVAKGVTLLLRRVGFERMSDRIGLSRFERNMGIRMDPAALLGKVVFWFLFLIFLVPAINALGLTSVSGLLSQVIAYIPNVFVAILVLLLGALVATLVADLTRGATASANIGNPNVYANIVRYAIIAFSVLIALEQLQIAPALITTLFTAVVGALALAFGLAFGLGGRDTAQRLLNRSERTISARGPQGAQTAPIVGQPTEPDLRQRFNQGTDVRKMQPDFGRNPEYNS